MIKAVFKNSSYLAAAILATSLLEYLYQVSMAHLLTPGDYGLLSTALAMTYILVTLLTAGLCASISKFVPEDASKKRVDTISSSGMFVGILSALILSAMLLATTMYVRNTSYSDLTKPLIAIALILPLFTVLYVYRAVLQGLNFIKELGLTNVFETGTRLVISVLLVYAGFMLYGALVSFLLGVLLSALLAHYILRDRVRFRLGLMERKLLERMVWFSIPTAAIIVSYTLFMKLDVVMLKFLLEDNVNETVGYYNACATLARLVFYVSGSIPIVLLPAASMAYSSSSRDDVDKRMRNIVLLTSVVLIPAVLVIAFFSRQILLLVYPDQFAVASPALGVLAVAMGFLSLANVLTTVSVSRGEPGRSSVRLILCVVIYAGMLLVLIPAYGMMGAAYATLAAGVFAFIGSLWVIR